MNKVKREESKILPKLQVADNAFDLRTMDSQLVIRHLEEQIKARELPIEQRLKKQLQR